jgi:Domain of unknown function (DUF6864)
MAMPVIRVGGEKIIESGSLALSDKDTEVELQVADLTFILVFVPGEGETPGLKGEPIGNKSVRITLTNWYNQLGSGFKIPIGKLQDKELYFAITSHLAGDKDRYTRLLTYTFSLRELGQ